MKKRVANAVADWSAADSPIQLVESPYVVVDLYSLYTVLLLFSILPKYPVQDSIHNENEPREEN